MKKNFLLLAAVLFAAMSLFAQSASDELRFLSDQNGSSIGFVTLASNQTIEYSSDGVNWTAMTAETTIPLNNGDSVYMRGKLTGDNTNSDYTQFAMSGSIAAKGSINYLWDYENLNAPLKAFCGFNLFENCTVLKTAPTLPATILAEHCYQGMFHGCAVLTNVPELPADSMTQNCYTRMFQECTSLTSIPSLPATKLANQCYWRMFRGCTSINSAPAILPAKTLAPYCYNQMFMQTAITKAPELPASTLDEYSYYQMFLGCNQLNHIKCMATDISATGCTQGWVNGVASSGTFVKNSEMSSWTTGNDGIPSGWTTEEAIVPVSGRFQIGDLYYILNGDDMTAAVTYRYLSQGYANYSLNKINVPSQVTYQNNTYDVTSVGDSAFCYIYVNTYITLPNSVTNIGKYAFNECKMLQSISLGDSVKHIGHGAFRYCEQLTSIEIPNSVEEIEGYAFHLCHKLKRITIGNGLRRVGEDAFMGVDSLKGVYISDLEAWCQIKWVIGANDGNYTNPLIFARNLYLNNELLTDVVIPSSITTIKNDAFRGDSCITSLTIHDKVTSIETRAFCACQNIHTITCEAVTPPTLEKKYVFYGVDCENTPLYVPKESVSAYRAATTWKDFKHIIPIGYTGSTISFVNWDGTELLSLSDVEYGVIPEYTGATPTRPEDEEYTYTFTGWTPEIVEVTEDVVYTATFEATPKPQGINDLQVDAHANKLIHEGNVYILRGEKVYTATGQEVK
jgi:hypothetical protein